MSALHGDDLHHCGFDVRYNFSSNVSQPAAPDNLRQVLNDTCLHQYPDTDKLTRVLAASVALAPEQLLLCNGASEAIYLLAQCFNRHSSHIVTPTFCEYELASLANQHSLSFSPALADSQVLWLCNPNNPDGKEWSPSTLRQWLSEHPKQWLVVDESYGYQRPELSMLPWLNQHPNLIVINSLTKAFAIPALRLGYLAAPTHIISKVAQLQPPWPVNSMALAAGLALVDQAPSWHDSQVLQQALARLPGVSVQASRLSFFCFSTPILASEIKQMLGRQYAILVRDASNIRGCTPYTLRVCSQGPQMDQVIVQALSEVLK